MPSTPNFFSKPNTTKPNPKKNFIQNYSDHLKAMGFNIYEVDSKRMGLDLLNEEIIKRILILDALRDGYDYADEVLGATVLPPLMFAGGLLYLAISFMHASIALAMKLNLVDNDQSSEHMEDASESLIHAACYFLAAAITFVKSAISVISRPLVTAIHGGFKPTTDEPRFYSDNPSLIDQAREFGRDVGRDVRALLSSTF